MGTKVDTNVDTNVDTKVDRVDVNAKDHRELRNFCTGAFLASKEIPIKTKKFIGRTFSVVPATIIKEGSFYPSGTNVEDGALFVGASEIYKSTQRWNGRGVSLEHPSNGGLTLNNPKDYNNQYLGLVFNSKYSHSEKAIKTEFWLDNERASDIIERVKAGEEIDVSIGAYGAFEKRDETNENEKSISFVDIRPDHVAILPFSEGACDYEHGCGIRAKKVEHKQEHKLKEETNMDKETKGCNENVEKSNDSFVCGDMKALLAHASPELKAAISESMSVAESVKAKAVDTINSIDSVKFCDAFFEKNSLADLNKVAAIVADMKDIKDAALAKEESVKEAKTNFSANAPSRRPAEDLGYVPIKDIDLNS